MARNIVAARPQALWNFETAHQAAYMSQRPGLVPLPCLLVCMSKCCHGSFLILTCELELMASASSILCLQRAVCSTQEEEPSNIDFSTADTVQIGSAVGKSGHSLGRGTHLAGRCIEARPLLGLATICSFTTCLL